MNSPSASSLSSEGGQGPRSTPLHVGGVHAAHVHQGMRSSSSSGSSTDSAGYVRARGVSKPGRAASMPTHAVAHASAGHPAHSPPGQGLHGLFEEILHEEEGLAGGVLGDAHEEEYGAEGAGFHRHHSLPEPPDAEAQWAQVLQGAEDTEGSVHVDEAEALQMPEVSQGTRRAPAAPTQQ